MRLIVRENNLEGARKSQCTRRPRARHALSHFAQTTSHYVCSCTFNSAYYIHSNYYIHSVQTTQLTLHLLLYIQLTLKSQPTTSSETVPLHSNHLTLHLLFSANDSSFIRLHLTLPTTSTQTTLSTQLKPLSTHCICFIHPTRTTSDFIRLYPLHPLLYIHPHKVDS